MRVDPNLYTFIGAGIDKTAQTLQGAVQQLSSGLRVASPSEDPTAAAADLRSLAASAMVDSYTRNSETVLAQSQMADSVLSGVVSTLTQALTLGTQAANGTATPQQRSAIATQVQALLQQAVNDANRRYNGASLFAGTLTAKDAFVADTSSPSGYIYQGDSSANQVPVGDGIQLPTGIPGDKVFTNASGDVLGSLSQMATAITSGTTSQIAAAISAVNNAISNIGQQRAAYAGVSSQLQEQESYLSQETVSLTSQQQALTGVDMTAAIEQLTQAQTAHTAVLAAAAKILPLSLLNYLNPAG